MRFDRGTQNFGFHMIAQSQLIADDRRRSQEIEHGSIFCCVFPYDRKRSQTYCDLRSAIIWKPALSLALPTSSNRRHSAIARVSTAINRFPNLIVKKKKNSHEAKCGTKNQSSRKKQLKGNRKRKVPTKIETLKKQRFRQLRGYATRQSFEVPVIVQFLCSRM